VTPIETALADHPVSLESIKQAAQLARGACKPIDDVRGSARYRSTMVRNLTEKVLVDVWERIKR
jgi:CO/xanthine dehydrogenase FAD-binding subunit